MNFSSIISSVIGFASGGWGSVAAVVALLVAGIFLYWKYKQAVQKKAEDDTKNQAAIDQAKIIAANQKQSGQIAADESENKKALEAALKKIEAAASLQKSGQAPS